MSTEIGPRVVEAAPAAVALEGAAGVGGGANVSGAPAELTRAGLTGAAGTLKGEKDEIRIKTL